MCPTSPCATHVTKMKMKANVHKFDSAAACEFNSFYAALLFCNVAVGQNQWYHFGVGAPLRDFDPWPCARGGGKYVEVASTCASPAGARRSPSPSGAGSGERSGKGQRAVLPICLFRCLPEEPREEATPSKMDWGNVPNCG